MTQPAWQNEVYGPRTLRDFQTVAEWIFSGLSNSECFSKMQNSPWRSDLTTVHGHLFCRQCDQLIECRYCSECGQSEGGNNVRLADLELEDVFNSRKTTYQVLRWLSRKLLITDLSVELVVDLIHGVNSRMAVQIFASEVELILADTAKTEKQRLERSYD